MSSKSSKKTTQRTAEAPAPAGKAQRDDLPERVAVGRVLRPHGVRGELVVQVLSDVPDRLDAGRAVWITRDTREEPQAGRRAVISSSRPHKTGALLRFEGIEDRDQVEALRGSWLEVDRSEVPPAPEGTFYHYELLGCRCSNHGEDLGEVVDLLEDGGGLLLIVSDGERRVPVPFVQAFLRRVDVAARVIELDLPPGLLEECASRS